jgi:hypothetical protein
MQCILETQTSRDWFLEFVAQGECLSRIKMAAKTFFEIQNTFGKSARNLVNANQKHVQK